MSARIDEVVSKVGQPARDAQAAVIQGAAGGTPIPVSVSGGTPNAADFYTNPSQATPAWTTHDYVKYGDLYYDTSRSFDSHGHFAGSMPAIAGQFNPVTGRLEALTGARYFGTDFLNDFFKSKPTIRRMIMQYVICHFILTILAVNFIALFKIVFF